MLCFTHCVLVLPGLDGLPGLCDDFVACLHNQFGQQVHQLSYPTKSRVSFDDLANNVTRALSKQSRPCLLVAQSFSGHVAFRVAAREPKNLDGMIFVNSFVKSPVPAPLSQWLARSPLTSRNAVSLLPPKPVTRRILLGSKGDDVLLNQLYNNVKSVSPEVLSHRFRLCLDTDSTVICSGT